jgi:hypothetical protein
MINACPSLLRSSTRNLLSFRPPLQMWSRYSSSGDKSRFKPVTIPYEALSKTTQTYVRTLERSQKAATMSALSLSGICAWAMCPKPSIPGILLLTAGSLFPLFFISDKQTITNLLITEALSLSTDAAFQGKVNQLTKAPYISIEEQGRAIKVSPMLNGSKLNSDEIVIPSYMLNPKIGSLRAVLEKAQTPKEAIAAVVLPKYLKGEKNPLKEWSETSRVSVSIDPSNNLFLDRFYSKRFDAIKIGSWEGYRDAPDNF